MSERETSWKAWNEPDSAHFKVTITDEDMRNMTHRQRHDLYTGMALMVAAFESDERFIEGDSAEDRADSVRVDEFLAQFLRTLES